MIRLDGGDQTLLLQRTAGPPRLAYWGSRLPEGLAPAELALALQAPVPQGGLDTGEVLDLFPEAGRGFTGHPALEVSRAGGGFVTQLLPESDEAVADGWRFDLADPAAGVAVVLTVTLDPETGVAAFRSSVRNIGVDPLSVHWLAAAALPSAHDEVLAFDGRWAREFQPVRSRVRTGLVVKENRTGRTSHHAPPFLVVGQPGFSDEAGRVLGLHLGWSGDARMLAERLRDGRVQVQSGEILQPGAVSLSPGESLDSPVLYAARSDAGLNGLSARLHPFVRRRILGGRLKDRPRPVHFNTWEAVYFDHRLEDLKALADLAAEVGAERFILDDGWFRGRTDDTRALGDWTPDPLKYPHGLGPLVDHVRSLGLEFGLWVEPEMANADSDLLRAHPDWTLHNGDRVQPLGRGQYVLDLTRPEVSEAVFGQLDALLRAWPIGYLKWDMNRDLTHAASYGRPAARTQTLAVYALMDRVRAVHPGVEIESCASGGGRADYEVLRRTDRIWTSDCNDPFDRQSIQAGASIFFPPEVLGAHVGPESSHTTGRRASLMLRAYTALTGHMGVEADVRAFKEADRRRLAEAIGLYKAWRGDLHAGLVRRLDTGDPAAVATMSGTPARSLVSLALVDSPAHATPAPIRLAGLEPEARYRVTLLNPSPAPRRSMKSWPGWMAGQPVETLGALLMEAGISPPILRAGEIALIAVERRP